MKLGVVDGLRHTNLTGYGALSRNIIFGLEELGHELALQARGDREWGKIERDARERLESFPVLKNVSEVDMILQVGTPASGKGYPKPTLIYTQNALGDLRDDWVAALRQADGCIVPSQFDKRVFDRYIDRVYVAHQSSDPKVFRPVPAWTEEGSRHFTFLFVGTYSYRKGIDLLLEAFLREFDPSEGVELLVHAPGLSADQGFNHLLSYLQRIKPRAHIRLFGRPLSPEWMCRIYNRADCVVTLSRGEGWCMPVTEALLCETPVIAPDSTAMGEYLTDDIAFLVPTREVEIGDIGDDPFARGFVAAYGHPGNLCYEPDVASAQSQMRAVVNDPDAASRKAVAGRSVIRDHVNWKSAIKQVEAACLDLLGSTAEPATA